MKCIISSWIHRESLLKHLDAINQVKKNNRCVTAMQIHSAVVFIPTNELTRSNQQRRFEKKC